MASKRRVRRNGCDGKIRYASKDAADQAARRASKQSGQWISGYGCRFCKGFHIGHPPRKKKTAGIDSKAEREIK